MAALNRVPGHCYEMPAIINVRYLTRYMLQNVLNKFLVSPRNVSYYNKRQVPYLEMLGTSYSRYTQNYQVLKCHINDLLPLQCDILCRHLVLPPLPATEKLQEQNKLQQYQNTFSETSVWVLKAVHRKWKHSNGAECGAGCV